MNDIIYPENLILDKIEIIKKCLENGNTQIALCELNELISLVEGN